MAATLATTVNLQINATLQNSVGLTNVNGTISKGILASLLSGVGANQADKIYSESAKSIAASGTYDLDLAGTLLDIFGAVCTFLRVKLILITADAANVNNVQIGAAAATQFLGPLGTATDKAHVRPGGAALFYAPDATAWAVGAGATDLLRLTNSSSGTAVLCDILIIGASA